MGRFLKALVMTLLLMEITAIVALTAVWTILSELHASHTITNMALGITAVGLCILAAEAFRRALAAERRLEGETPFLHDLPAMTDHSLMAVNAISPGQPRPVQLANVVASHPLMHRP